MYKQSFLCLDLLVKNVPFSSIKEISTYLIFGHHLFDKTIPLIKRGKYFLGERSRESNEFWGKPNNTVAGEPRIMIT